GNFNGVNFLYVANSGSNNVSGYGVDPNTGALTPLAGSPFTMAGLSAPTSITATQFGNGFLYATNPGVGGGPGSISAAVFDFTTGALTDVQGSPFHTGVQPTSAQVLYSPSVEANFLLEANTGSNTLSGFGIDSTNGGLIVPTQNPTIATGNAP